MLTRRLLLAALPSLLALPAAAASHGHGTSAPELPKRGDTRIYLLRGLFGVFSTGMDELAGKLTATGYMAEVHGWDDWTSVADTAIRRFAAGEHGPIVVIGHSLGANAVFEVAGRLDESDIPVAMGVTFDATEPARVPENVELFYNFWAADGFGHPVEAIPGYTGTLENFDLSGEKGIDHTSIDAMNSFHQFIIGKLETITSP